MSEPSAPMRHSLISVLLPLLLIGCDLLPAEPLPVDGAVLVHVREAHGVAFEREGAPTPGVFLATEDVFDCENHRLLALVETRESQDTLAADTVSVDIVGVGAPETCRPGEAPAHFGRMLDEREDLVLELRQGDRLDRYDVRMREDHIETTPIGEPQLSRVPHPVFWNFPPRTFAFLCRVDAAGDRERCSAAAVALSDAEEVSIFTFPSGGAIPYPVEDPSSEQEWSIEYFSYDSEETFAALGDVVADLGEAAPGLALVLMNWRNERISSASD